MKKTHITISGPVSSMKTPIARRIQGAIKKSRPDLSCTIFDHELFSFDENFQRNLDRVKADSANSDHDICIIVIGTGSGLSSQPLKIEVEPAFGAHIIFNALEGWQDE